MRRNPEGLTYNKWLAAAGYAEGHHSEWEIGEDPTEHRARLELWIPTRTGDSRGRFLPGVAHLRDSKGRFIKP